MAVTQKGTSFHDECSGPFLNEFLFYYYYYLLKISSKYKTLAHSIFQMWGLAALLCFT